MPRRALVQAPLPPEGPHTQTWYRIEFIQGRGWELVVEKGRERGREKE